MCSLRASPEPRPSQCLPGYMAARVADAWATIAGCMRSRTWRWPSRSARAVFEEAGRPDREADPILTAVLVRVRAVTASHRHDVAERIVTLVKQLSAALETDPVLGIAPVLDGDGDSLVAHEVAWPAPLAPTVDDQPVALQEVPDQGLVCRSVGIDLRDRCESRLGVGGPEALGD